MIGVVASRALAALTWFALLAAVGAALDSGPEVARQRYLPLGLYALSAQMLLESLRRGWSLAAAAALGVALAPLAWGRFARVADAPVARWAALGCAAALAAAAATARGGWPASGAVPPNIALITVDTLRADHLGVYGYPRNTSPAIDRLASEGLVFRHAVAQAPWTLPSMASVLTGLYPSEHGAVHAQRALRAEHLTLAEVLRDRGYRTVATTSHIFVAPRYGFAQGFEEFDHSQVRGHDAVTSEDLTRIASELARRRDRRPYFLWVHYFDPHYTYVRHREFDFAGPLYRERVRFDELQALEARLAHEGGAGPGHPDVREIVDIYDEEVAYTDHWIGRLLDRLRAAEPERRLVIFFTADHGEHFIEKGTFGHKVGLFEPLIHVPLIIAGDIAPAWRGGEIHATVEIASLPRTVLAVAGIEQTFFGGEDLLALRERRTPRPAFSEDSDLSGHTGRARSVIWDGWKLIHDLESDSYALYHLASDAAEQIDRWTDTAPEVARVRKRLTAELASLSELESASAAAVDLEEDEANLLRDLGYLQ